MSPGQERKTRSAGWPAATAFAWLVEGPNEFVKRHAVPCAVACVGRLLRGHHRLGRRVGDEVERPSAAERASASSRQQPGEAERGAERRAAAEQARTVERLEFVDEVITHECGLPLSGGRVGYSIMLISMVDKYMRIAHASNKKSFAADGGPGSAGPSSPSRSLSTEPLCLSRAAPASPPSMPAGGTAEVGVTGIAPAVAVGRRDDHRTRLGAMPQLETRPGARHVLARLRLGDGAVRLRLSCSSTHHRGRPGLECPLERQISGVHPARLGPTGPRCHEAGDGRCERAC